MIAFFFTRATSTACTDGAGQCPSNVDESSTGPVMALLQSQKYTQRGPAVDHDDEAKKERLGLVERTNAMNRDVERAKKMSREVHRSSGKMTREVDRSSGPPCMCQSSSTDWKPPAPRAPRCLFIDLGAADGNTFRSFAADGYGSVANCPSGGQYDAVLVEANPHFDMRLAQVRENHLGNVRVLNSTAAYMCEGNTSFFIDTVTEDHNYWGSSLSSNHKDVIASGKKKVTVPTVNVARLLVESALPEDYVILKMDIEGAEWDIVPCLAKSPETVKLIDAFYMEKHPNEWSLTGTNATTFEGALLGLTQQGVNVPEYFSDTF